MGPHETVMHQNDELLSEVGGSDAIEEETSAGDYERIDLLNDDPKDEEYDDLASSSPRKGWWKEPSVIFLFPPFFLLAFIFGGLSVPKLNLVLDLICVQYYAERDPSLQHLDLLSKIGTENSLCDIPAIQSRGSNLFTMDALIGGILGILIVPRIGALSDRHGRVKFLTLTTCGLFMDQLITLYIVSHPLSLNYNWLLLGSFLENICGSITAAGVIIHAYTADCLPSEKRKEAFSFLMACASVGGAFGPFLSALLLKASGSIMIVLYIALILHFLVLLYIWFLIPESLELRHRSDVSIASKNPVLTRPWWQVFAPLAILWPRGPSSSRALRVNLASIAAISMILTAIAQGVSPILFQFSRKMFKWDIFWQSVYSGSVGVTRFIVLAILFPVLLRLRNTRSLGQPPKVFGKFDVRIIQVAIIFELLGFLGYLVSWNGAAYAVSGLVSSLDVVAGPALQASLLNHVSSERSGEVLSASAMLHGVARLATPSALNSIYSATVGYFPQLIFLTIIVIVAGALILSCFLTANGTFSHF